MSRLLNYGEGFIRAAAAKIWLAINRAHDGEILRRLSADDHPAVASAMLDGIVRGWASYAGPRRVELSALILARAAAPADAAAMMDNLVRFDRVEYSGKQPPWELFGSVMPVALNALPTSADFMETRLYNVVSEARGEIAPEVLALICDSWLYWLERAIGEGVTPGDYLLGIVDLILDTTRDQPDLREGQLARAFALPGTYAPYTFVGDMVGYWSRLGDGERQLVIDALNSARSDVLWLRAAVLTSPAVPEELQGMLLPAGLTLNAPPEDLIGSLPPELLEACVHSYTGHFGRLGDRAHRGRAVWQPVVDLVVRHPEHPLFPAAWQLVSGRAQGNIVGEVIQSCGLPHAELFLDLLIKHKVSRVGDFMPEAWSALFGLAPILAVRRNWLAKALSYLPAIADDIEDLEYWLSDKRDRNLAFNVLGDEIDAVMKAKALSEGNEVLPAMLALVQHFSEEHVLLRGTHDRILGYLKKADASEFQDLFEKLREVVSTSRLRSVEISNAIKEKLADKVRWSEPPGWIAP